MYAVVAHIKVKTFTRIQITVESLMLKQTPILHLPKADFVSQKE